MFRRIHNIKISTIGCLPLTGAMLFGLLLLKTHTALAATYNVTANTCQGPGSIVEAIQLANANPGSDTIEFAAGLTVSSITASTCGTVAANDPAFFYLATVTDDVLINGNNAELLGAGRWITPDGRVNVPGLCPSNRDLQALITAEAPGFLRIEPGAQVEINDLYIRELSAIIGLRDTATAELNNVKAIRINDWYSNCDRSAIDVFNGDATLRISDSIFEQIQNSAGNTGNPDGSVFRGSNIIDGSGELTVSDTYFEDALSAIQWKGNSNIQSSRFLDSGWVNLFGPGTTNIVNSTFQSRTNPQEGDSLRASSGAVLNVIASTTAVAFTENLPGSRSGFGSLVAVGNAVINITQSAIGVALPAVPGEIIRVATGGSITADASTWIQPVNSQSAAALRTLTGQPALLTDPPGLPNELFGSNGFTAPITPLLGTAVMPGVLIDAIPDANGANELLSPIDGAVITRDIFGNPRVDGNGTRTIGAVQLTLAPNTLISGATDSGVTVSWSRPKDPAPNEPITGYGVTYVPTDGSVAPVRIEVAGANTLTLQLTGLSPNTEYQVTVVGVNQNGDGPPSNVVTFGTQGPTRVITGSRAVPALSWWMLLLLAGLLVLVAARKSSWSSRSA